MIAIVIEKERTKEGSAAEAPACEEKAVAMTLQVIIRNKTMPHIILEFCSMGHKIL
jgi:hypothetical protein